MRRAHGGIAAKWIAERNQPVVGGPSHPDRRRAGGSLGGPSRTDRGTGQAFRERGLAVAKQDQQIGGAVVVGIDEGANVLPGRRVEVFNQIDLIVEIPIRFPAYEDAAFVILLDVRAAVEIGVDVDFGRQSPRIIVAPDIRATVVLKKLSLVVISAKPR